MANVPLDTRFIGISTSVNLDERRSATINAETQPYTMADIVQTANGGVISVTKLDIDALINDNSLTPGAYYLIEGVDVPLYGGTTILIQAATTNKLALAGHGIFYNPKYLNSQLTPNNGYGIWSNYITLTMSNIVGTFATNDTVTANNGATATYLANGFFSWISGDWSTATTIDNGVGATADVTGGVSPSYAIGDDVIWGGKHWTNTSGNVGIATDKYTLSSSDWTAVPFNSTDYNVVADIIHYDYSHDMIIRRKDKWDNDVDGNFQVFILFESSEGDGFGYGNPIKDFQWGNGPEDFNTNDYNYIGVQSNYVKDSYLECINFIARYLWANTLTQESYMFNNVANNSGDIYNNTLNSSSIEDNTLTDSYINNNTLTSSYIKYNTLTSSNINNNILNNSGYISNNIMLSSSMEQNNLHNDAAIDSNKINNSYINGNKIEYGGGAVYNILSDSSSIQGNNMYNNSVINNSTLNNNSAISFNEMIFSTFNFSSSGTLVTKQIRNIEAQYSNATFDISTATIIYGNYSKQMFRNSVGVTQLGYYDASNVFTIVNVNS